MGWKVLDERWNEIVSSHFGILEKRIFAMLMEKGMASETLRGDLRWAISRTEFDELVKREIQYIMQFCQI